MANKRIFRNAMGKIAPATNMVNEAGGRAYQFAPKAALAQYAVTGVFNGTYYVSAKTQLDKIQEYLAKVNDAAFVAKLAVYARKQGFMKDMPAFLLAHLASRSDGRRLFDRVFDQVIDNGKMLQNFVQVMRSGVVGRNSLGSMAKRKVKGWFNRDPDWIFKNSIGSNPSLADILKLSHPHPLTKKHEALFAYLLGKDAKKRSLPALVKAYEKFKANPDRAEVPKVPFQFLASLDIPEKVWKEIAKNGGWHMVRMNLNTFARHGVLDDEYMVELIADKLRDEDQIRRSRVFPYQLMTAFMNARDVPSDISLALQDAMEIATQNVPAFGKNVYVFPDVSGSMSSPVTGYRRGSTSKVNCIDVAALVAATVLRTTPQAEVIPFECRALKARLNPRDSIMTNAKKLARMGGGGTNCSAPLEQVERSGKKVDLVIYVSDNESWVDSSRSRYYNDSTATMKIWKKIKRKNPNAKMVCIDITPYDSTQAPDSKDILNVGGFSDQIFTVIDEFVNGSEEHWVDVIERVEV